MNLAKQIMLWQKAGGGDIPLPPGGVLIDYLQGVSGAGIVLPWAPSTSDRIEMDAQFTNLSAVSYNGGYYTSFSQSADRFDFAGYEHATGKFRINYGPGNDIQTADTNRHLFILDALNNKCSIDSNIYALPGNHYSVPSNTPYLGVLCRLLVRPGRIDGINVQGQGCRCFTLNIYRNDVLGMSLIPFRIGSTGYLLDCLSGQYYGNYFSGSFVLGPDKT